MQGFEKIYVGRLFPGYLKWEVMGARMTFKKAEMAKTLENGLSMIEMNPLNHNWSHFVILLGLTLHQFQKKLLLRDTSFQTMHLSVYSWVTYKNQAINLGKILIWFWAIFQKVSNFFLSLEN